MSKWIFFRFKDQVFNPTETTQQFNSISKYLSESKSVCSGEKAFFQKKFKKLSTGITSWSVLAVGGMVCSYPSDRFFYFNK